MENPKPSTSKSKNSVEANLVSIPESFPSRDPLGLNELTQPTYSYSLDDGLHNFIIHVTQMGPVLNNVVVVCKENISGQVIPIDILVRLKILESAQGKY